jgi:hypothetical protein
MKRSPVTAPETPVISSAVYSTTRKNARNTRNSWQQLIWMRKNCIGAKSAIKKRAKVTKLATRDPKNIKMGKNNNNSDVKLNYSKQLAKLIFGSSTG